MNTMKCLQCLKPISGRTDKKFCTDGCRISYNNKINSNKNSIVKNINSILIKNRRILQEFLLEDNFKIPTIKLLQKDFNFHFYTDINQSENGDNHFFCYDYGYYTTKNDYCILIKQNDILN
jgi:predicted nucleic acid-binding Zn ribbon protein